MKLLTQSSDTYRALVGIVQICSTPDQNENFKKIQKYVDQCADLGAKLICLPENFNCMTVNYADGV